MRRGHGLLRLPRWGVAKLLVVTAVAGGVAVSAQAFTASNTVPAHKAGVGVGAITGYTVVTASVNYTFSLDGADVEAVSFDVGAAATDVAASLDATPASGNWVDCTNTSGTIWSCDFVSGTAPAGGGTYAAPDATGYPVGSAVDLTIAAVSSGVVTLHS